MRTRSLADQGGVRDEDHHGDHRSIDPGRCDHNRLDPAFEWMSSADGDSTTEGPSKRFSPKPCCRPVVIFVRREARILRFPERVYAFAGAEQE